MNMTAKNAISADKEKSQVALTSVFAAVGLTSFKIVIGLLTNSLGILAEAAHSALDLVAALVTFLAVRLSGKPADEKHNYGHGKIENLSALFETLLLLLTCVWIIYEAYQRLFGERKGVEVEASIWSFIVMGTSIIIDYNRSRMLDKAAKKYKSQALEADALHFSTDIWSSSVVIIGLIGVVISDKYSALSWLAKADAVAACGVAIIVIYVSMQLGKRTVMALLDTAPDGLDGKIKGVVEELPGVVDCHQIRVRQAGPDTFIDVHVLLDGNLSLVDAHTLTEKIETAILKVSPSADITVHPEPVPEVHKTTAREKSLTTDLIAWCAEVPSFTTYEDRIHKLIGEIVNQVPGAILHKIAENNLVLEVPGKLDKPVVAFTAHLDKINHFGLNWDAQLPVSITDEKIIGQLDDAVGIGLCLSMMVQSKEREFPPLLILLSEWEEGLGLKNHPEWLRNDGAGVYSGLGAERICTWLMEHDKVPGQVITIDMTPLFKGNPGLAIYTHHWEKNELIPSEGLLSATEEVYQQFKGISPAIERHNNTNDYLTYGRALNRVDSPPVVSIALEPSIYPYHQIGEEVFLDNIDQLEKCIVEYLEL